MQNTREKINGIRSFQRIRRYLSKIYLYGYYSREDAAKANGGSAKNYDMMMGFVRQLMPSQEEAESKRSAHSFRRDYHKSGENHMFRAYMLHAMDHMTDMMEYLCMLARLAKGSAKPADLVAALELMPGDHTEEKKNKKEASRRNRLLDYGVIKKQKSTYQLALDPLKSLSDEQLQHLADYVQFSAMATYPRVAGSFLERTVERELYIRGLETQDRSPLLLRHNTNHNCLDEELVYQLRLLMEKHRYVLFDDRRRLPVKIRVDTRLGRWYILCLNDKGTPCVEKITSIKEIKEKKDEVTVSPEDWSEIVRKVDTAFAHTLCSGLTKSPVLVKAKMEFTGAPGIRKQFMREILIGDVVEYADGEYYEAWVTDLRELKPILRAYGPYLRLIPSNHDLKQRLATDYQKMLHALDTEVPE